MYVSGPFPPSPQSAWCLLESLQHSLHWCPGWHDSSLPQSSKWHQEPVHSLRAGLHFVAITDLVVLMSECAKLCVPVTGWCVCWGGQKLYSQDCYHLFFTLRLSVVSCVDMFSGTWSIWHHFDNGQTPWCSVSFTQLSKFCFLYMLCSCDVFNWTILL